MGMYKYTFLLRMTDTMTSLNIVLSSWNTLYNGSRKYVLQVQKIPTIFFHLSSLLESRNEETKAIESLAYHLKNP
jgi:hypothetical protein